MNTSLAFATVAHFALAAASEENGSSPLTIFEALGDVAQRLGLEEEQRKAEEAAAAIRQADHAQLTFDAFIRRRLETEDQQ